MSGFCLIMGFTKAQNEQTLTHLSSYETSLTESAEVVAYDPISKRAYFTNTSTNSLTIIDISNPATPTLVLDVALASYGAGPNSVAVHNGIVAVAVENNIKTDNGVVVFFDTAGAYLGQITVGALPDMLTFTHDGSKLLVANEGEPSDDYTIDPDGSVSIIDLSLGIGAATVTSIDFTAYNDKKASLQNRGIRIFGNNGASSVAQDIEPEYIAVTEDDSKAYVSCQENNAFAVIDLSSNSLVDLMPLGYKNHSLGTPKVDSYYINELVSNWPDLGAPLYDGGQPMVKLGGFSGLFYDEAASTANDYVFYAVPDRGPNADAVSKSTVTPVATQNLRPFKLPDYQSRIVKFTFNKTSGNVTLDNSILLTRKDGTTPISGKGNVPGFDEVPVTYTDAATPYTNVDYVDGSGEEYHELPYDEFGGDFEGVLRDKDGNFWLCDEYRPSIYKFDANGVLIERYVPSGTSLLGTTPQTVGYYGEETLPAVYAKRWANRGFEGIAYDSLNNLVYAFIQSPLFNPSSVTKNNSDVIRILGINALTGMPVSEYVYLLERNKDNGYAASRVDKIGDANYIGNGKFLVLERDSEGPTSATGKKYVFEIDINCATNILDSIFTAKELEEMSADEIVAKGIRPVHKNKVVNLPSLGYQSSDKTEGVAMLPNNEIAIINDNDFGLAGAGITDNSVLGIVSFDNNYGFDASNTDNTANIMSHPTLGMFMPDGIASYNVGGVDYIVTANEGDSRDYSGYSEEERVKDLVLDTNYYPNAAALQANGDLGRLKTTTADGDYDMDGEYEQIYSYGARSFSIFDNYGNLVFDSGDDFAQIVLTNEPTLFNEDEGEMDGRSDDKGMEPEAVAIGTIGAYTYAFIGFERQSSIVVYDITNPKSPEFITFYSNRTVNGSTIEGDVAPEIIKFITSADSPNSENLLLVGYEVSGSVGIIQVGSTLTSISEEVLSNTFEVYPNPISNGVLNFSTKISGKIYDVNGKQIKVLNNENNIDTNTFTEGVYIIKTNSGETKRFLKL